VPQVCKNLVGHSCPYATGVDELALIAIVVKQQRAEIGPRAFGVRPTDDDQLLAVERLGLAP
jgi:hypothetical protein